MIPEMNAALQRILDLDPQMLDWALGDLLSEEELAALKERLAKLKIFLRDLKARNKLIQPNQWNAMTAKGMLDNPVVKVALAGVAAMAAKRFLDKPA